MSQNIISNSQSFIFNLIRNTNVVIKENIGVYFSVPKNTKSYIKIGDIKISSVSNSDQFSYKIDFCLSVFLNSNKKSFEILENIREEILSSNNKIYSEVELLNITESSVIIKEDFQKKDWKGELLLSMLIRIHAN